jgi:hypothetical protein
MTVHFSSRALRALEKKKPPGRRPYKTWLFQRVC